MSGIFHTFFSNPQTTHPTNEENWDYRNQRVRGPGKVSQTEAEPEPERIDSFDIEPYIHPVCYTACSDKIVPHLGQVWEKMPIFYLHL